MKHFLALAILALVFSCNKDHVEFCEDSEQCNLVVSPLPFDESFEISLHSNVKDTVHFKIFDMKGSLVLEYKDRTLVGRNVYSMESDSLSTGIYILLCSSSTDTLYTRLLRNSID